MAQVGRTKKQATEKDQVTDVSMTDWFTYRRVNEPLAKAQLTYDANDFLVGAAVISEQADDLINDLTLLINQKVKKAKLDQWILGYPTLASDLSYLLK